MTLPEGPITREAYEMHRRWKESQDGWEHRDISGRLLEARFSRFHGLMLTVTGDGNKMGSTVYVDEALPSLLSYIAERAPEALAGWAAVEDYAPWLEPATGDRHDSKLSDAYVYSPRDTFPPDERDPAARHTPSTPMEEMHREAVIRAVAAERELDQVRAALARSGSAS